MKLPSFQFYPGDWQKDPALRSVSHAAKGLWVDMLCLMFESERRGYLQINGKAPSLDQLARMVNSSSEVVAQLLSELRNAAVFSESAHNIIFSRRMVKDAQIRSVRSKCGKLGGNPAFEQGKSNPYYKKDKQNDNQGHKLPDKQKITPSSSSSSSSSDIRESTHTPPAGSLLANKFAVPATEKEAVEWAAAAGVPPDFAKSLYHQCEGRGWVDGSGAKIQMWSSYAKSRHLREAFKQPNAPRSSHQKPKRQEFEQPPSNVKEL
jgi:hypothetical protein